MRKRQSMNANSKITEVLESPDKEFKEPSQKCFSVQLRRCLKERKMIWILAKTCSFNKEMENVKEKEPKENFRTENTITVIKTWVNGLNSRVEGEERRVNNLGADNINYPIWKTRRK